MGLPGAGKSTFSGALKESAPDVWEVLSQDEMGSRGAVEDALLQLLKRGKRVIVDKCSVTRADRKTLLDILDGLFHIAKADGVVHESVASSILLARMCAAVGETCFVVLVGRALALHRQIDLAPTVLIGMCVVAQCFATTATIFKIQLCFVVEGILWLLMMLFVFVMLVPGGVNVLCGIVASALVYMSTVYMPLCMRAAWTTSSDTAPALRRSPVGAAPPPCTRHPDHPYPSAADSPL